MIRWAEQMAGVLVGYFAVQGGLGRLEGERDQQFGDILGQLAKLFGFIGVGWVFGQQLVILFHGRAAAGRSHHDTVDSRRQEHVDVMPGHAPAVLQVSAMDIQGAAAFLAHGHYNVAAVVGEHAHRRFHGASLHHGHYAAR